MTFFLKRFLSSGDPHNPAALIERYWLKLKPHLWRRSQPLCRFSCRAVVFIITGAGCVSVVLLQAHTHQASLRQDHLNNLSNAYSAAIDRYQFLSRLVFDETIQQPEVLKQMTIAAQGSTAEQTEARQALYRLLQPTYENLEAHYDLRQLHFHLPDSTSFLRFHRPEKFGDSLLTARPSVRIVNETKQPIAVFEEGRIFNGFRYVFPLFSSKQPLSGDKDDRQHIGSVEVSASFSAIQQTMEQFSHVTLEFLIAEAVVKETVFDSEKSNYQKNDFYPSFVQESQPVRRSRSASVSIDQETLDQLAAKISDRVTPRMAESDQFVITERLDHHGYLIGFLPVKNIDDHTVGYIISYIEKPEIAFYDRALWIQTLSILALTGILWGFVEVDRRRAELSRRGNELKAINQKLEAEVERRVETEQCLLKTNQDLEQEVMARTHAERQLSDRAQELERVLTDLQSAHLQLIQQEKMSSLGVLVAGVAHEINNSINFIHGNLDLLDENIADVLSVVDVAMSSEDKAALEAQADAVDLEFLRADLPSMLQSMHLGANRTRQIVRSLRNFSRLDESERKEVDLHKGIESTLVILGHRLKGKGERPEIEVTRNYHPQLPLVSCYPGPFNQVIMNLLSNAIDAIEERWTHQQQGGQEPTKGHLDITTCVEAERSVQISIQDNGTGMSESTKQRAFDHLFTTKISGKGTGLGLAISRNIIENQHRGTIICDSSLDRGTMFTIQLPLFLVSEA